MNLKSLLLAGSIATLFSMPVALAAMPPAQAWEIGPWARGKNYSVNMPAHPRPGPNGSLQVDFPRQGRGEMDAMTIGVRPLAGAKQITLRYRIDAARGTRFVATETPEQAATVSLYFQRAGDNWSGKGRYMSYRWYVPARAVIPLSPGTHEVTVKFDEAWTNVHGRSNRADPSGFEAALRNTSRLGLAFGSRSRRSHGVAATGQARFTLLDLNIE